MARRGTGEDTKIKQTKFWRGLIGSDEYNDIDYATQQQKSATSFAIADNIITQASKKQGNYFYKRPPMDFVCSIEAESVNLIPFTVSVEPQNNKAQMICLSSAKDQHYAINYNQDTVSVQKFPDGNVAYEKNQLDTIDFASSGGMLFLSHKNVPLQVMYYNKDNPSITEFQFKTDTNTGSASNNYYKFFRTITGNNYMLDPNISIKVFATGPFKLKLLNNKNYKFVDGDILRITHTVDVTKVKDVNSVSVWAYIMDCKIKNADPQGINADFDVINGSSDFSALMSSGGLPYTELLADGIGLNYENQYFKDYADSVYPSGVAIVGQRLFCLLGNTIFLSGIGDYFNFYQSSKIFSDQPFQMTLQQNENSSGIKMSKFNSQVFFPTTQTVTFADYDGGKLIPHSANVSAANIKPVQFESVMLAVHGSQRSIMPLYYVRNTDRVNGQGMENLIFNPKSDFFTGSIIRVDTQNNPEQRILSLIDDGSVLLANIGADENGNISGQGVSKIKHSNGNIVDISVLNLSPQSTTFVAIKKNINGKNIISIEKFSDQLNIFDNTDDVFLDRRTKHSVFKNNITYNDNSYMLNIYGVNNTYFDGESVIVVIKQKDLEDIKDNLVVKDGNIYIPKHHFDNLNTTDPILIYSGVEIVSDFAPIINIPYNQQSNIDYTLKPNNVKDLYMTIHSSSSKKILFSTIADNSIIENPPQTLDSEIVDRIYFDMAFSQDRNILQKPHFSTIRNNDYNFFAIQEIGYSISWGD